MCVSGGWTESYQARRYFAVRVVFDTGLLAWIARRSRAKRPMPRRVSPVVIAGTAATIGVRFIYNDQIRRFWKEIRDDWEAHERMLAEDPRNR
jgi:hypothetical protein